jgi:shikimate dehydrogenase
MGWPITHSLSPRMHNAAFIALGLDWVYVPFPVPPERLAGAVRGLVALGFSGCNATIPHKPGLARLMDALTPIAAAVDSVNTIIIRPDGSLLGDSTDGHGFMMDLWAHGVRVGDARQRNAENGQSPTWKREGGDEEREPASGRSARSSSIRRAVVIGAGGAARAVVFALAEAGVSVAIANRTPDGAEELSRLIERVLPAAQVSAHPFPGDLPALAASADLIVNTTSLGLHGDADALPWDAAVPFRPDQVVYDLIYNVRTPFLRLAEAAGAYAIDGLGMLVHQGARSAALWTGADERALAHWMQKELYA